MGKNVGKASHLVMEISVNVVIPFHEVEIRRPNLQLLIRHPTGEVSTWTGFRCISFCLGFHDFLVEKCETPRWCPRVPKKNHDSWTRKWSQNGSLPSMVHGSKVCIVRGQSKPDGHVESICRNLPTECWNNDRSFCFIGKRRWKKIQCRTSWFSHVLNLLRFFSDKWSI